MATGERPFEGKSAASVIGAILKDPPAALSSREPLTPATLDQLVGRCLEKDPDERWQNAGDLKRSLIDLSPAGLPTAPAAAVRHGTWAKVQFAAAILASGLAAGLVLGLAWPSGEESLPRLVQFEVLPPLG